MSSPTVTDGGPATREMCGRVRPRCPDMCGLPLEGLSSRPCRPPPEPLGQELGEITGAGPWAPSLLSPGTRDRALASLGDFPCPFQGPPLPR